MTTVFLSGSRNIRALNDDIRRRIDNMIRQNFRILVGDANGADKAMQTYLAKSHYQNVIVYCSGETCRNNIGQWNVRKIAVPSNTKGRKFYAQKDKAMAIESDYGFMLWDGKSAGTLANLVEMVKRNRNALVYLAPERSFIQVTNAKDARELVEKCHANTAVNLLEQLNSSSPSALIQEPITF